MPKKKIEPTEEEQAVEEDTAEEIKEAAPETAPASTPLQEKVEQIISFFPEVGQIFGEPFDPDNQNHLILAAFYVGSRGLLRR